MPCEDPAQSAGTAKIVAVAVYSRDDVLGTVIVFALWKRESVLEWEVGTCAPPA